jgi:hypothetical protein
LRLGVASLLAGVVVAFTRVPVRILPPGSPGTDPDAGAVVYESLSEFSQTPAWLVFLAWVVLWTAVWYGRDLFAGGVPRWILSMLALGLAMACVMFAGWGYWMSVTGYEVPQMGKGAYPWWLLSSSALTAVAVGVVLLPRLTRSTSLRMVAAMATSFVPPVAALLVVGHMQSESGSGSIGFPLVAGAVSVIATVALFVLVFRLWRRETTRDGSTSLLWLNRMVLIIGTVVAMFWLVFLVFSAIFVGGGLSVAVVPFGPVLFGVVSFLPIAAYRDLAPSTAGSSQGRPSPA